MNRRELARDYFKKNNLSYEDIGMNEIYKLIQILNKRIAEAGSCMLMINEPKLRGRNTNIKLDKAGNIKYAEIRVKGTYFNDREAITFYEDGWIGLCGWADGYNITPFVMGFKEWCDYLVSKKVVKTMSKKHLGMTRPVRQFDKAVNEMVDYINAFNFLPPRGDGAKEQAINEWKQVINNVVIQLNNIKNTQIDLIMRGGDND